MNETSTLAVAFEVAQVIGGSFVGYVVLKDSGEGFETVTPVYEARNLAEARADGMADGYRDAGWKVTVR